MKKNMDTSAITDRIGRLFIGGMPGPEVDLGTIKLIKDYNLSGIILFKRNIKDPVQLASLCNDLQEISMDTGGPPLFLCVDQEGGRVSRLKEPFARFPGNRAAGESPDPEKKALDFARTTAREMSLVGLNMNMAPVMDVTQPGMDSHLEGRTFSNDPFMVARLGTLVIKTMQQAGVMSVSKHFPGLGGADIDPHRHLPYIRATREEMDSTHLYPFLEAIKAGVSAVMGSHAVYPALDPETPATLSRAIMTGLLREKMGFQGLIISDDLEMGAISGKRGVPDSAADAFEAGNDLMLICENQDLIVDGIDSIKKRVDKGRISSKRIKGSLERIKNYKVFYLHPYKKVSLENAERYFLSKKS